MLYCSRMINFLIIIFAKYLVFVIPFLAIIFFLLQKKDIYKKILMMGSLIFPLAFILSKIASAIYYNPRPFVQYQFKPLLEHAADNGFPSDHALLSFTIAALVYIFDKKVGIMFGILGFVVGISRVLAGIHSPIDIIGSLLISVVSAYVVYKLLNKKY